MRLSMNRRVWAQENLASPVFTERFHSSGKLWKVLSTGARIL